MQKVVLRHGSSSGFEVWKSGYNDIMYKAKSFRLYDKAKQYAIEEAGRSGSEFINNCKDLEEEPKLKEVDKSLTDKERLYKAIFGDKKDSQEDKWSNE